MGYGLGCVWLSGRRPQAVVECRRYYRNLGGEGPYVAVVGLCFRCFQERRQNHSRSTRMWGDMAGYRDDWIWLTTLVDGSVPT